MVTIGTISEITEKLELGIITEYNIKNYATVNFVDFGEIQTVPWGQAFSRDLDTLVAIYIVVGESLDPTRERKYVGQPLAKPLFN